MKKRILFVSIMLFSITCNLIAQSNTKKVTVSGFITDVNKKPIQDVFIVVDNVKMETYINSKGFYKIKIPANAKNIIVFSINNGFVEHQFEGEKEINFTFNSALAAYKNNQPDENQIDVGYGSSNKENLTSSVGSVKIDKNNTYLNIFEMIAGKVPGVVVSGNKITIRGQSSVNAATDPLFVVNGSVTNNVSDISPSDVDNISILKGSSAAMYGSRGANGVILINLKKAKKDN